MNCNSRYERNRKSDGQEGSCLQVTELEPANTATKSDDVDILNGLASTVTSEVHTVDFEFSPPPQMAHFVSVDGGLLLQHVNPLKAMLVPSFEFSVDTHPNTAVLNVPPHSSVIIIWRNRSLMDHPFHLHGRKMEILNIYLPIRNQDCTLSKCKLSTAFDSVESIAALDSIPIGSSILKDTFILPAGGAVATRIQTDSPALWFAHCHVDNHRENGMAFILNVGNYQSSTNHSWLPKDYPSCNSFFLKTRQEYPACNCYRNEDAVLDNALTKYHRCSRDHLCHHEHSQAANLNSYGPNGFRISSNHPIPNWAISLIVVSIIVLITILVHGWTESSRRKENPMKSSEQSSTCTDSSSDSLSDSWSLQSIDHMIHNQNFSTDSFLQKLKIRVVNDWKVFRPTCTNRIRLFEVTGLALLTGYLFYDVGNDSSATGLSEKYSLLFFSITLWTFTRMYPAVGSFNDWYKTIQKIEDDVSISDIAIWCFSRCLVIVGNEGEEVACIPVKIC